MKTFHHLKFLLANRYEPENMRALIDVCWRMLLGAVVVCMIGIFAYGAWELMFVMGDVETTKSDASSNASSTPAIQSGRIDAILGAFSARRDRFESLRASPTPLADPAQ